MMKWLLIILSLLLAIQTVSAEAKLEIRSSKFEFGAIPAQSTISHSFWFHSSGTDTVNIQTIKTGCQCTTMPLKRDWLAPGDSMKVEVFWDLGRRVGKLGQYPRVFVVGNPDPLYISLTGSIFQMLDNIQPVSVMPYKATFAKTGSISIDSISFTFTNHSAEDLTIDVVSSSSEYYEVNFPSKIMGGAAVEGYVKISPLATDVEFKGSITVETEGIKKNRLTIPVLRKFYK